MLNQMLTYPRLTPSDARMIRRETGDDVESKLFVIQTPFGYRRMAGLFLPDGHDSCPLILYLHWYEPESADSNRSQFAGQAVELARKGAICLTVETLWSDSDFFLKRTQKDDARNSIEEVINLRRFMDFLLSLPQADPNRFAVVGHDFGGMYGILAGSLDGRPTHYVVMAATPRFSDWYLYLPKLEGKAREAFIHDLTPIDPLTHVSKLSPAPVFFQFGDDDFHVPMERARELFDAAVDPKEMKVYESGHGLNEVAAQDRHDWLVRNLSL